MNFQPKKGQKYWLINSRWEVKLGQHNGSNKSKGRIAAGNAFKTHKEAQHFANRLLISADTPINNKITEMIDEAINSKSMLILSFGNKPTGVIKPYIGVVLFGRLYARGRKIV